MITWTRPRLSACFLSLFSNSFSMFSLSLLLPCCVQSARHSHLICSGFIPSIHFLVRPTVSAPNVLPATLFQHSSPQWICTRADFDPNMRKQLAHRVHGIWDSEEGMRSAREELCDFNLLVYAASLGVVDVQEIQALTRELVKPVVDETKVRALLMSDRWMSFVSLYRS